MKTKFQHEELSEYPKQPVEVVFGMPSKRCERHGICRIDLGWENRNSGCLTCERKVPGLMQFCLSPRELAIQFKLAVISEEVWQLQFAKGVFLVVEPFMIEDSLRSYLGMVDKLALCIAPGPHPFFIGADDLQLHLRLRKPKGSDKAISYDTINYYSNKFSRMPIRSEVSR